ncbi:MAG: L,D-transpeptidase [Bacteroidetes bacterium]|nr:L,D-transpeptidase [Bacteroidota bacterium]
MKTILKRSCYLTVFILFFFSLLNCNSKGSNTTTNNPKKVKATNNIQKLIDSLKLDKNKIVIYIDKSDLKLSLKIDTIILKSYDVVLGGNQVDDKRQEGDGCTPEGKFKVRAMYPHKSWSKFIWIDYPTKDSEKKFNASKKTGEIPKDATIGGQIGIHGVPEGCDYLIDKKQHWTLGCISLKNENINEVYKWVKVGTKITIVK